MVVAVQLTADVAPAMETSIARMLVRSRIAAPRIEPRIMRNKSA